MSNLTLNITNGDCAVESLKTAGIKGEFLAWRDVLHIGPLLPGNILGCFEESRVLFLSQFFDLNSALVKEKFRSRHKVLSELSKYQVIRLWFEHDLYDQLQLIQILAYLSERQECNDLRWVVTDQYIGPSNADEIHALFRFDEAVPSATLAAAPKLWKALTQTDPTGWSQFDGSDLLMWPFITQAFERLKKEFPDKISGLSQSQSVILALLIKSSMKGGLLFSVYSEMEWGQFMADMVFKKELDLMINAEFPLLSLEDDTGHWFDDVYGITPLGRSVFAGEESHVKCNGIDRWIAGVHLESNNYWCFNKSNNQLEHVNES